MCDFDIMLLGLQNTLVLFCCLLVLCTQGVHFMQAHIIKGTLVYVVEGNKGNMLMILLFLYVVEGDSPNEPTMSYTLSSFSICLAHVIEQQR